MTVAGGTPACTWSKAAAGRIACGCGWHWSGPSNKAARRQHHRHVYFVRQSVRAAA